MKSRRVWKWCAWSILVLASCLCLGQNCAAPPSTNVPVASACGLHAAYCVEVVGRSPMAITAGDFNGDGMMDVAAANFGTDNVELLFNTGGGSLVSGGKYKVRDSPGAIVAADFDSDGDPDLAAGSGFGVAILANRGDGIFSPATYLSLDQRINAFPVSLTAADLDGDGIVDLATSGIGWIIDFAASTTSNADNIIVLRNNAFGTFTRSQTLVLDHPFPQLGDIADGDVDGDGRADLVVDAYPGRVIVLLNVGNATFEVSSTMDLGENHVLSGVKLVDLNGDDALDLIVADNGDPLDENTTGGDVAVFFNQGGGVFGSPLRITTGIAPTSVAVADLNLDGRPDLAVANNLSDDVSIVLNQGGGSFAAAANFATGDGPTSVVAADFSGDGIKDLAVSHMISGAVGAYLNNGAGSFICGQ
ncbi:MAG TPA: VCBS repeat-containing protein [Phycisphaerae bacterium]|nr:VCBS repeat-containing protein [Phycisphaerae bacterium]